MVVILPCENHPLSPNCPHSDEAPTEARLIHANCIQLRLSLQLPDHKKSISATISRPQTSVTWGPLVFSSCEVRCLPSLKSITFNLVVAKSHFGSSQTQRTDGPVTSTLRLLLLLKRNSGHEPHSWCKGCFTRMLSHDWWYNLFRKISLFDKLTARIQHTCKT